MPSLPPDNEVIGSNEDAYNRYFGYLRTYSPLRPRILLLKFLFQCLFFGFILLSIYYFCFYFQFHYQHRYESNSLYYLSDLDYPILQTLWIFGVLVIIYTPKNLSWCLYASLISSIIGYIVLCVLSYETYHRDNYWNIISNNEEEMNNKSYCKHVQCNRYTVLEIWMRILHFPIILILALFLCHFFIFKCCWTKLQKRFELRHGSLFVELQDTESMADSSLQRLNDFNRINVSYENLEQSSRSTLKWVVCFAFAYAWIQMIWFVLSSLDFKDKHNSELLIIYLSLWLEYSIGKYLLKRIGQKLDQERLLASLSLELVIEVLVSSFYWFNLRKMIIDFQLSWGTWLAILMFHMSMELYRCGIRPTFVWFNHSWKLQWWKEHVRKSNWKQWQERCNLDNAMRFVVCLYSFIYINIMLGIQDYWNTDIKKCKQTMLLFAAEFGYYCCIILFSCFGQVEITEPLMRIFSAYRLLFLSLFICSLNISVLMLP